jgi:hypothetical protein
LRGALGGTSPRWANPDGVTRSASAWASVANYRSAEDECASARKKCHLSSLRTTGRPNSADDSTATSTSSCVREIRTVAHVIAAEMEGGGGGGGGGGGTHRRVRARTRTSSDPTKTEPSSPMSDVNPASGMICSARNQPSTPLPRGAQPSWQVPLPVGNVVGSTNAQTR